MLNILGMIILIIILFIIILLLIGIKIAFIYDKKESKINGCLKILIFKKIKVYSIAFPSEDKDSEKVEDDGNDEKKQRDIKKIIELAKPCFNDLMNFLKDILNTIRIKKIENHLIFGMDDYAETGKYIGIIWAVLAVINPLDENLRISAEPSFNGSRLDAYGTNELEIYPLKLLIPTVKLISKKNIRKLIRGVLDERWWNIQN